MSFSDWSLVGNIDLEISGVFCGSTTFLPGFFCSFSWIKPSLAWKWYPFHRWWRPLATRRWGVAPVRPSIFTPLEAVEGCMAAMNVLGEFLWWFLCCGVILKKAGLGQETSREAKIFLLRGVDDSELRRWRVQIWRFQDLETRRFFMVELNFRRIQFGQMQQWESNLEQSQ